MHFECVTFTQNSLVLISYLLNYSQQFLYVYPERKFKTTELLKGAIITEWQNNHNVSLTVASMSGDVVLNVL